MDWFAAGIQLESDRKRQPGYQLQLLPEKLYVALELCLNDEHEQVRRAAAIALYTLEHPTDKVSFPLVLLDGACSLGL